MVLPAAGGGELARSRLDECAVSNDRYAVALTIQPASGSPNLLSR
jgi:hypothetical protein